MMAWSKVSVVSQFMEKLLDLIKEEALVGKFDISSLVAAVKSLGELQVAIYAKFGERTDDEQNS
jgi:hypothetical protein